jgi:hypothetical protein
MTPPQPFPISAPISPRRWRTERRILAYGPPTSASHADVVVLHLHTGGLDIVPSLELPSMT